MEPTGERSDEAARLVPAARQDEAAMEPTGERSDETDSAGGGCEYAEAAMEPTGERSDELPSASRSSRSRPCRNGADRRTVG